jgi:hypothetical protein
MSISVNDLTEELGQRLGPFSPLVNIPSVAAWALREMGYATATIRNVTDADLTDFVDDDADELFDLAQYACSERILDNLDPVQLKQIGVDEAVDGLRKIWRERVQNIYGKIQKQYGYGLPRISTGSIRLPDTGTRRGDEFCGDWTNTQNS